MIVFVTTRSHAYTVAALINGTFGFAVPKIRALAWEDLFYASRLPAATYIFTDMDRLSAAELGLAARVYQAVSGAGLRCLNNPARVRFRYAFLHAMHANGGNDFAVYRAEAMPRPARFPVFIRGEADHTVPFSGLLADQAALDEALAGLQSRAVSLRHLLVIEFCAAPIAPGVWRKYGTFRLGEAMHLDHAVIEDNWLVKQGSFGLATPKMFAAERDAVAANTGAEALRPAFDTACLDYGRADHAMTNGREAVYEINTNPHIQPLTKQRSAVRDETMAVGRRRFAALLDAVDTRGTGSVEIAAADSLGWRRRRLAPILARLGISLAAGRPV